MRVVDVGFSIEVFCILVVFCISVLAAAAARAAEVEDEQDDGIGSISFMSVNGSRFLDEPVNVLEDAEEMDDAACVEKMVREGLLVAKEAPIVRVDEQSEI